MAIQDGNTIDTFNTSDTTDISATSDTFKTMNKTVPYAYTTISYITRTVRCKQSSTYKTDRKERKHYAWI